MTPLIRQITLGSMKKLIVLIIAAGVTITTSCTSMKDDKNKDSKAAVSAQNQSGSLFLNQPNTTIGSFRQITFEGPKSGEGYFSTDGSKMIFQSERQVKNPFYQMYVMDLITGQTTRLSTGSGKTTCGWIHPNLKKAMWSSTHLDPKTQNKTKEEYENRAKAVKQKYSWSFDDQFDIFESDLQGKNIKRLTKELGYDAEGSYSPDGQWIAFASNRNGYSQKLSAEDQKIFDQDSSYMMDIYIMKADGTQVKQLTTAKGYDGGPFFSADGKKITWRRFAANGSTAEIYTMNVDGSQQKQVTNLKAMSWAPYYHPSDDYIIFASSILGYSNFELFIVDSGGTKPPVRVTFDEGFDGLASFSPNGNQITWTHRNEKGESQIYLAPWDDAQARKLLGINTKNPTLKNKLSSEIKEDDLKSIVYYLASEEMQGRSTGSPEELQYTHEISELFKLWGLKPANKDFIQAFEFTSAIDADPTTNVKLVQGSIDETLKMNDEYQVLSFSQEGKFSPAQVIFAGYGIKAPVAEKFKAYNSYQDLDVKGKWVILLADLPPEASSELRQHLSLYSRLQHKVTVAKNEGAAGIIVFDPFAPKLTNKKTATQFEGQLGKTSLAVIKVSQTIFEKLMGTEFLKSNDFKKITTGDEVKIQIKNTYLSAEIKLNKQKKTGHNVIGFFKAGTPTAKSILIGAHGDHLGTGQLGSSLAKGDEKNKIHYGADDNASGVAAVLELAHYFSKNKNQLKHNIYFAIWSGEEIGLLGSQNFIDQWNKNNKPLEQTFMASINLDMVGRLNSKLQVQGLGSAAGWKPILEEVALKTGLSLTAQDDPYLPTDSMSLYMAKLPSISLFTGSHAQYHTPADKPETLNYNGLFKITEFTKLMAERLADTSYTQLTYNKVESTKKNLEGRSFRVFLGTIPDYTQEGVKGVKISGTSKDSPAEKAGLIEKDVIVSLDNKTIENIYDYVFGLQSLVPNKSTKIQVLRSGKVVDMTITPALKE